MSIEKKKIPNLIKVQFDYDLELWESLLINRINGNIENGYSISHHDFNIFCAILLKNNVELPKSLKEYIHNEKGQVNDKIHFELINLKHLSAIELTDPEKIFFKDYSRKQIEKRKKIMLDEIRRTGISLKKLKDEYHLDLKNLISIINDFREEIFVHWFIPIRLTYEKLVHIFVKHVEETKFGEGQFKKRTFFTYDWKEIIKLLQLIIENNKEEIKEFYLENYIASKTGERMRSYRRRIIFNNNEFSLQIDENGLISKFHEI